MNRRASFKIFTILVAIGMLMGIFSVSAAESLPFISDEELTTTSQYEFDALQDEIFESESLSDKIQEDSVLISNLILTQELLGNVSAFPGKRIVASYVHSMVLKEDGTVWSWGNNANGQLGCGTYVSSPKPVQVRNLKNVVGIDGGIYNSYALREDGTVWAWGGGGAALGTGSTSKIAEPTQVLDLANITIKKIASGYGHVLAIDEEGNVYAWGKNSSGQIGDGTTIDRNKPVLLNIQGVDIAAGNGYSLILKTDGTVWAWGKNTAGELGDGSGVNQSTPVQVKDLSGIKSIYADNVGSHSYSVDEDGVVWSWGSNESGRIGIGNVVNQPTPVKVPGYSGAKSFGIGTHALAVMADGSVRGTGWGGYGKLGNGTTVSKLTPYPVSNLTGIVQVSGSYEHSLALQDNGTVWAFGRNENNGQLGDGTYVNRMLPVQVIFYPDDPGNLTSKVITVGNPFNNKPAYARNVWDMQKFDEKIYFGYGNWSNTSVTANNAGPVSIYSLSPETDTFSNEYSNIPEEAIDTFRIINDKLYIPGVDSTESWNYGNFYVLKSGSTSWKKYRTVPGGLHVFDMAFYNGKLYTGIGVDPSNPNAPRNQLLSSTDEGSSWISASVANPHSPTYMPFYYRITSLFQLEGNLYGAEYIYPNTTLDIFRSYFIKVSSDSKTMVRQTNTFVPGASLNTMYVMRRQLNFNDKLLFILFEKDGDSDDYILPFAMYSASSITSGAKITFPETGTLPIDIITRNNEAYVLGYIENSATNFTNIVYKTNDLNNWKEVFRFDDVTFARSFEEINGDFYFGMGAKNVASPSSSSGRVLKVEKSAYR